MRKSTPQRGYRRKVVAEYKYGTMITLSAKKSAPWKIWYSPIGEDGELKKRRHCYALTQDKAKEIAREHERKLEDFYEGRRDDKAYPFIPDVEKEVAHIEKKSDETVEEVSFPCEQKRGRAGWGVEKAVEEFIRDWKKKRKDEEDEGVKPMSKQYQKGLFDRLRRFARDFKGRKMFSFTEEEIDDWRSGLTDIRVKDKKTKKKLIGKSKNEYVSTVKQLFRFCKLDTIKDLEFQRKSQPKKEFYSVSDVKKILDVLRPKKDKTMHPCYPAVVLSVFAGLRQSEAILLDWSNLNKAMASKSEQKTFLVGESKTGERAVDMNETLIKWLEIIPEEERTGVLFKTKAKDFQRKQGAFTGQFKNATKDVVEFKRNALRHSFGTYFLARCRNAVYVAEQMGNSREMVKKHYAKAITYEDSEPFWNLTPYTKEEEIMRKVRKEMALALEEKSKRANEDYEKRVKDAVKEFYEEIMKIMYPHGGALETVERYSREEGVIKSVKDKSERVLSVLHTRAKEIIHLSEQPWWRKQYVRNWWWEVIKEKADPDVFDGASYEDRFKEEMEEWAKEEEDVVSEKRVAELEAYMAKREEELSKDEKFLEVYRGAKDSEDLVNRLTGYFFPHLKEKREEDELEEE